jgi:hypothetical protein
MVNSRMPVLMFVVRLLLFYDALLCLCWRNTLQYFGCLLYYNEYYNYYLYNTQALLLLKLFNGTNQNVLLSLKAFEHAQLFDVHDDDVFTRRLFDDFDVRL